MSLQDVLANPPQHHLRNRTRLDAWYDDLDTATQETILVAVLDTRWPHTHLLATLQEHAGAPDITTGPFSEWRKRKGWSA